MHRSSLKWRRIAVVLAGLCLWPNWASAEDLMAVYRSAQINDAQFAAARAQYAAGLEKEIQARAGLLPSVGASLGHEWVQQDPAGSERRNFDNTSWGVQLTQPLFRQQNRIAARQGELLSDVAEVNFALARQDLMLRVADAYFEVLHAQDALRAVQQLRTAAQEQLEIARTSFDVGTVTITDVHEAQSRFDLAQAQVIAAESALAVAQQGLFQIIGREPQDLAGLPAGVKLIPPQPADPLTWSGAAEADGFGVQLQALSRQIAEQELARARAGHYPTVDLVASHGYASRQNFAATRTDSSTVGIQVNVPLYAGGAIASQAREAAALLTQSEADLEHARRQAALAARQAFVGVTSGLAQIAALEAAELSSGSALEANKLGYEVGVRINIDVLNAQSQLANTRLQLARARYDTLLAQLRLKAAAGALTEADLERVNSLLRERHEDIPTQGVTLESGR